MSGPKQELERVVGLGGATALGLGSILGTGVFVSIGLAANVAGPAVVVAVVLAAGIATCNGMSSAQLAAAHPVSGGTYEYGHEFLNPAAGFIAGWMFLCAKSASAATAALGLSAYLLFALGLGGRWVGIGLAIGLVALMTAVVLSGLRRSNRVNAAIVAVTIAALVAFIATGLSSVAGDLVETPMFWSDGAVGLLEATALMFVAYTGYGRIATLGEEVLEPRRTIPKAIITTLAVSALLYVGVALVIVGTGAWATMTGGAPLEAIAQSLGHDAVAAVVAVGAVTAMLGVLLNLILGLSRVLLAMGRRGDMPAATGRISSGTPRVAVVVIGVIVAALALIGDVMTTWSFAAFTVLIYYAITNFAALKLPADKRLYPRWVSVVGLVSCLFVAFWVDPAVWLTGVGVLAAGLGWRVVWRRRSRHGSMQA